MRTRALLVLVMALSLLGGNYVYGSTIMDTGEPSSSGGWGLDGGQYLAAQFQLSQADTITEVAGWMARSGGAVEDYYTSAVIYSNVDGLPGTEIYAQQFLVPIEEAAWQGVSGLSWSLPAGTYWLAFEVRDRGWNAITYSFMPNPAPDPPLVTASWYWDYEYYTQTGLKRGTWTLHENQESLAIGVRIEGTAGEVPIPPAALLFGSGLVGLIGLRISGRS